MKQEKELQAHQYTVEMRGDYALFTRPEFNTEKVSYEIITPSSIRGILESIYWHPGITYCADKIYVCNEPEFIPLKRNGISKKISAKSVLKVMQGATTTTLGIDITDMDNRQQFTALILRNPHYFVTFHFELDKQNESLEWRSKVENILLRRLEKGQCFNQPSFGPREFPAYVSLVDTVAGPNFVCPEGLKGERDLGWMLFDCDYSNPEDIRPMYFHARMRDGVVTVPDRRSLEVMLK